MRTDSYFDGGLLELVGIYLLGAIITLLSAGIALPWSYCMVYGWRINHTVIEGRRLKFNGKALDLFWHWIKWFVLIIITLGIYSFWVNIKLEQWRVKNTSFASGPAPGTHVSNEQSHVEEGFSDF